MIDIADLEDEFELVVGAKWKTFTMYENVLAALNVISVLLLVVTSLVYFVLPQTQDAEGKCVAHLTFVSSLLHAVIFYRIVFRGRRILPNVCITDSYVPYYLFMALFVWSLIFAFQMWIRARTYSSTNESKLRIIYVILGYGIPAIFVGLAMMHAHLIGLYDAHAFEIKCAKRETVLLRIYAKFPPLIIELSNGLLFLDIVRGLWNPPSSSIINEFAPRRLKTLKYRLKLNGKLIITMGLPWVFIVLILFIPNVFRFLMARVLFGLLGLIVAVEGVFIFLIMVVFRRRVFRSVCDKVGAGELFQHWTNGKLEESLESYCEETGEELASPA